MSFENIQLPPFLIQDLYKDYLIDEKEEAPHDDSTISDHISYLGKNEKGILILINEEDVAFLHERDLNFLIEILNACRLSLSDIAIVNIFHNHPLNSQMLIGQFNPVTVLLLGVDPASLSLPLNFPHYQVQRYAKQTYLSSPNLKQISADKQLKLQLWESLKKIFSL